MHNLPLFPTRNHYMAADMRLAHAADLGLSIWQSLQQSALYEVVRPSWWSEHLALTCLQQYALCREVGDHIQTWYVIRLRGETLTSRTNGCWMKQSGQSYWTETRWIPSSTDTACLESAYYGKGNRCYAHNHQLRYLHLNNLEKIFSNLPVANANIWFDQKDFKRTDISLELANKLKF